MLTIFSTPKPFTGNYDISQANAIGSWRALSPDVQILLFGGAPGIRRIAGTFGAENITEVKCTERGIPLFNSMHLIASNKAIHSILCFLNADIVLPPQLLDILPLLSRFKRFMVVGHRHDLNWTTQVDFTSLHQTKAFWKHAEKQAKRHSPSGIDYFIFKKGMWRNLPKLVPGRAGIDNWLLWKARRQFIPVIDASARVKAVHLNHDYSHHPEGKKGVLYGKSAQQNRKAYKTSWAVMNILDATWKITENGLVRKTEPLERNRFYDQLWRIFPELAGPLILLRRLRNRFFQLYCKR